MKVLVKQVIREWLHAEFAVLCGDKEIGRIKVGSEVTGTSAIAAPSPVTEGTVNGVGFKVSRAEQVKGKWNRFKIERDDLRNGEIYDATAKLGLLKRGEYTVCSMGGQEYLRYSVSLGRHGVWMLYHDGIQTAQYDNDGKIVNEMHDYEIYAGDDESLLALIIICIWVYSRSPDFTVREYRTRSVSVQAGINKDWIDKYDENWITDNFPEG